jgi:hypothetical protein
MVRADMVISPEEEYIYDRIWGILFGTEEVV